MPIVKILVAMSGGVDSSTIAHLLKEQGHELVGVMMKLWVDPLAPPLRRQIPSKCCSIEHINRARKVCQDLDIPFYVVNIEDEFKEKVVDPFIEGYANGKTPNPCIDCNRNVKFGALLKKAEELGCDIVATGHYARIAEEKNADGSSRMVLLEAVDQNKDQSYYLYALSQDQLKKIMCPLGGKLKSEVFELADKYGVPTMDQYSESQDLCFYPEREPEAFLKRYIKDVEPGPIVTKDGEEVGTHKGLPFYTEGQRKGLGIGGLRIPLHVSEKIPETNTIVVVPDGEDKKVKLKVVDMKWVSWKPEENEEVSFEARIHSLGQRHHGQLKYKGDTGSFTFDEPIRGIAAGQALVLYRGNEIVGGGIIA